MAIDAATPPQDRVAPSDGDSAELRARSLIGKTGKIRSGIYARHGKRMLDIIGALVLLAVFLPLMAGIATMLRVQRGPVLFGHRRVGRDGAEFPCLKFRTMVVDAEERLQALLARDATARRQWTVCRKLDDDPRITAAGRFLRRSSLDELPQLFNVLRGEMSLVGPRPVTDDELRRYGEAGRSYLALRPGLTGLWQVSGRNDLSYAARVALDDSYARSYSLLGDLMLLVQTIGVVLGATGK